MSYGSEKSFTGKAHNNENKKVHKTLKNDSKKSGGKVVEKREIKNCVALIIA